MACGLHARWGKLLEKRLLCDLPLYTILHRSILFVILVSMHFSGCSRNAGKVASELRASSCKECECDAADVSFLFDRAYLRLFDNHLTSVSGMYSSGLLRAPILFYSIPVWTVACGMSRYVFIGVCRLLWGVLSVAWGMYRYVFYVCVSIAWVVARAE